MSGADMTQGDVDAIGSLINEARPSLIRMSQYLARRAWKGRLTLSLAEGHVAIVLTAEDAARVREMLG